MNHICYLISWQICNIGAIFHLLVDSYPFTDIYLPRKFDGRHLLKTKSFPTAIPFSPRCNLKYAEYAAKVVVVRDGGVVD